LTTPYALVHAKWEVLWVVTKPKKRIVVYDCGDDFVEARRIYLLARDGGKHFPTLRCRNVGFPPPERIRDKLHAYNRAGVWWCPYCMELRRFRKLDGFTSDLTEVWTEAPGYYCPMCDIGQDNGHVKRWNPAAMALANRKKLRRGRSRSGRRRKRK
jgi:hypothetical protein